jgi:hypothetical protein
VVRRVAVQGLQNPLSNLEQVLEITLKALSI